MYVKCLYNYRISRQIGDGCIALIDDCSKRGIILVKCQYAFSNNYLLAYLVHLYYANFEEHNIIAQTSRDTEVDNMLDQPSN